MSIGRSPHCGSCSFLPDDWLESWRSILAMSTVFNLKSHDRGLLPQSCLFYSLEKVNLQCRGYPGPIFTLPYILRGAEWDFRCQASQSPASSSREISLNFLTTKNCSANSYLNTGDLLQGKFMDSPRASAELSLSRQQVWVQSPCCTKCECVLDREKLTRTAV